jgi:hypothetical protein
VTLPPGVLAEPDPTSNTFGGKGRPAGTNVWMRPIDSPSRSIARSSQPSSSVPDRCNRALKLASSGRAAIVIGSASTMDCHSSSMSAGRSALRRRCALGSGWKQTDQTRAGLVGKAAPMMDLMCMTVPGAGSGRCSPELVQRLVSTTAACRGRRRFFPGGAGLRGAQTRVA